MRAKQSEDDVVASNAGASAAFGAAYYERFYETQATQVHDAQRIAQLGIGLVGMLRWFGQDVRQVLEVGAGPGYLRDWFAAAHPHVGYRSTEYSEYACTRYQHERLDVAERALRERFDLVVCQGVLQYLSADAAERAIVNLARMSRGFLYLEIVTTADARDVCDRERSDLAIHLRSGLWYRRRLREHFREIGCGLYCSQQSPLTFYELEAAAKPRANK
jgi:hypothetical protein